MLGKYPAPGYRSEGNGTLYNAGRNGYSYSSSVSSSNTRFLGFNYGEIIPQYSGYRAHGVQVRCLQE